MTQQNNNMPDVLSGPGAAQLLDQGNQLMLTRTNNQSALAARNQPRDIESIGKTLVQYAKWAKEQFFYFWIVKDKYGKDTVVKGLSVQGAMQALQVWGDVDLTTEYRYTKEGIIIDTHLVDFRHNVHFNRPHLAKVNKVAGKYGSDRSEEMAFQAQVSKAQRNVIVKMLPSFLTSRMVVAAMGELQVEIEAEIAANNRGPVLKQDLSRLVQSGASLLNICTKYSLTPGKSIGEIVTRNPKVEIEVFVSMRTDYAALENNNATVDELFSGEATQPAEAQPIKASAKTQTQPKPASPATQPKPTTAAKPKQAAQPKTRRSSAKTTADQDGIPIPTEPPPDTKAWAQKKVNENTNKLREQQAKTDGFADVPVDTPFGDTPEQEIEPEAVNEPPANGEIANRFDYLIPAAPKLMTTSDKKWREECIKWLRTFTVVEFGEHLFAAAALDVLGESETNGIEKLIKVIFGTLKVALREEIKTFFVNTDIDAYDKFTG